MKAVIRTLLVVFVVAITPIAALSNPIKVTGRFIAYHNDWWMACFDFCTSRSIFKVEKPKKMKTDLIVITVPYLLGGDPGKIFVSSDSIELKIEPDKNRDMMEIKEFMAVGQINVARWIIIEKPNSVSMPYDTSLRVFAIKGTSDMITQTLSKNGRN